MVKPTNGRVVQFHAKHSHIQQHDVNQPLAAIITHVWQDRRVNLAVFDSTGGITPVTDVTLVQEGDTPPSGWHYAEWMPYQKGQAAKTEEILKSMVPS